LCSTLERNVAAAYSRSAFNIADRSGGDCSVPASKALTISRSSFVHRASETPRHASLKAGKLGA